MGLLTLSTNRNMEKEVSFFINSGRKITLEVGEGSTCSEVIQELLECLQLPASERGAWQLMETWRGCGKPNPGVPQVDFYSL